MKQWLKSFVHNCVVHPAMPFLPVKVANWLHDKNANWAFGLERYDEVGLEQGLNQKSVNVFEVEKTIAFNRRNPEHIKALRSFMADFLKGYDDDGQPMEGFVVSEIIGKGHFESDTVNIIRLQSGSTGFVFNLFLPL